MYELSLVSESIGCMMDELSLFSESIGCTTLWTKLFALSLGPLPWPQEVNTFAWTELGPGTAMSSDLMEEGASVRAWWMLGWTELGTTWCEL